MEVRLPLAFLTKKKDQSAKLTIKNATEAGGEKNFLLNKMNSIDLLKE